MNTVGRRLAGYTVAAVLLAAAALLVVGERVGRDVESAIARWIVHGITGEQVLHGAASTVPAVVFRSGDVRWNVLEITLECAIAYTVAGLLVLCAGLAVVSRFDALRVLVAAVTGTALLVLVNQFRIVLLALVLANGGIGPFEWAHSFAGSVVSLFGLAATLFVVFLLVVRTRGRSTAADSRQGVPA